MKFRFKYQIEFIIKYFKTVKIKLFNYIQNQILKQNLDNNFFIQLKYQFFDEITLKVL